MGAITKGVLKQIIKSNVQPTYETSKITVVKVGVSTIKIAHAQLSNTAAPRHPFTHHME